VRVPFHVGIVVESLEVGMADLSHGAGVAWRPPLSSTVGPWQLRLVYSTEGPPYVELIEAVPDSPWPTRGIHHLGFWSASFEADLERLRVEGFALEFDGRTIGRSFAYWRSADGSTRVELLDEADREAFLRRWEMTHA
jgi:hypothetical protein